eukprot:4555876-Prymnesium_polylepis.1
MGACVPQALAVRLPRLMVHGVTSSEHISHVTSLTTAESRSDSDAVTCESIGGKLGSRGISAVYGTCTP